MPLAAKPVAANKIAFLPARAQLFTTVRIGEVFPVPA